MINIHDYKLVLESLDKQVLFELGGKFKDLDAKFIRREEWLCVDMPALFSYEEKDDHKIYYYVDDPRFDRPILRLLGYTKINNKEFVYQISAQQLNFEVRK